MLPLALGPDRLRLRVLCIGAHSDDIEIGCGGTLLRLLREGRRLEVTWAVLSVDGEREKEARGSVEKLLRSAASLDVVLGDLPDTRFPAEFAKAKNFVSALRSRADPDIVFTHRLEDRHQDHRLVAELTWQTWRDHLIFEYEIPKYEADLGQPNMYVPLSKEDASRKVSHLMRSFGTQRSRDWFSEDTFLALMRLRGIECHSAKGLAEAFHVRKAIL